MQYIYFGLIPFLVAACLVYRGWYAKKPTSLASQLLWVIVFAIIYSFIFNVIAGVACGLLSAIILGVWGNAIKQQELKRNPPSAYTEVSHDTYKEYEHYMNEKLGLDKSPARKKAKRSK